MTTNTDVAMPELPVVGHLHTLHTDGSEPRTALEDEDSQPFGTPGRDFDPDFEITVEPLVRLSDARAAIQQAAGAVPGWQWVPVEPTPEMLMASYYPDCNAPKRKEIYKAMLSAVPESPSSVEAYVRDLLWSEHPECCGSPVVGATYLDQQEFVCCGCPEPALLNAKQIVATLRMKFPEVAASPSQPKQQPVHLGGDEGGGVKVPQTVTVLYLGEGYEPFVCECNGKFTAEVLADIDEALLANEGDYFPSGPGTYKFDVTRFKGQYGEYGRCELAPGWEFDQAGFSSLDLDGEPS